MKLAARLGPRGLKVCELPMSHTWCQLGLAATQHLCPVLLTANIFIRFYVSLDDL